MLSTINSAITPDNLKTKLAPSNIQETADKAVESHEKLLESSTTRMNEMQIKFKKDYYVQTYNGENPRMDIMDVLLNFVSYKTPDDTRQTPKGTTIDLDKVIAGILPTLKDDPEYGKCENHVDGQHNNIMTTNKMRILLMRFMVDPSNSIADRVKTINEGKDFFKRSLEEAAKEDPLDKITGRRRRRIKDNNLWSKEDVEQFKSDIEDYRLPIMDAMFKFDDPELYAADKKAQAIAAAEAALAALVASPSPSSQEEEGFSLMQNGEYLRWGSSWWWWFIIVTFSVTFSFVMYMIIHPYTKWCACQQRNKRTRR